MRIALNTELIPTGYNRYGTKLDEEGIKDFARSLSYKAQINKEVKSFLSAELHANAEFMLPGWLGLVSHCYSNHEKLTVQPHDMWFIVLTELAREINENSDKYRALFTNSDEKQEINVPGMEYLNVGLVVKYLAAKINVPIELFLPNLSTADESVVASFAGAFCDMVKSYYSYGTFLCGIPEIEVTGTPHDWAMLVTTTIALQQIFKDVGGPVAYFETLSKLFTHILADVASGEPDLEFWKGIFTSRNIGSGGELEISGWIKDLYLAKRPGPKIDNFQVSLGVVPYHNIDTGRQFTAIYGAFGVLRDSDGFLSLSYGNFVFERNVP